MNCFIVTFPKQDNYSFVVERSNWTTASDVHDEYQKLNPDTEIHITEVHQDVYLRQQTP